MTRLFVAAWPDAHTTTALRRLHRPDETGVRWVRDENWHVTLDFIGDADAGVVTTLLGGTELPRAVAEIGPAIVRLGPRQLVVPAAGVDDLAAAVRAATATVGDPDPHGFRGHLTIARTKPDVRSGILGAPCEASWEIDEVALVRSELRPEGASYSTIATFRCT